MGSQPGFQLRGSAPERYEWYLHPIMAPFVAALIEAGRLQPGSAVLDVACGTGFIARAAAARVGPTGRIAGTDLNPGMLDVAAASSRDVRPEIEWRVAPAGRVAGTVWLPIDRSPYMRAQQRSIETVAERRPARRSARPSGARPSDSPGPSAPPGSARSSRARCSPTSACRRSPSSCPGT